MLTPKELAQVEFGRAVRGYARDEVDAFITRLVSEYEQLYRANEELRARSQALTSELEQAKRADDGAGVARMLQLAEESAAKLESAAREEAEATRARARAQADEIRSEAESQAAAALQSAHERIAATDGERARLEEVEEELRRRAHMLAEACQLFLSRAFDTRTPTRETTRQAAAANEEDDQRPPL